MNELQHYIIISWEYSKLLMWIMTLLLRYNDWVEHSIALEDSGTVTLYSSVVKHQKTDNEYEKKSIYQ